MDHKFYQTDVSQIDRGTTTIFYLLSIFAVQNNKDTV